MEISIAISLVALLDPKQAPTGNPQNLQTEAGINLTTEDGVQLQTEG